MKFLIAGLAVFAAAVSIYNVQQIADLQDPTTGGLSGGSGNISKIIRTEIENNPDIVINAVENYRNQQAQRQQADVQDVFADLKNSTDFPVIGNKDSDVTVVEFFDYNCGACRIMTDTIKESMNDAKYVLIDFPILSPGSRMAAKGSYAAEKIGQYENYHLGLMGAGKPIRDEKALFEAVEKLDINLDEFKKHYNSNGADAYIQSGMAVAERLSLNSTPSLIINGKLIVSALRKPQFDAALRQIRSEAK